MEQLAPTSISRRLPDEQAIPGHRLETLIGRGGMGEVYLAVQLSLGRKVAIKLLAAEFAREESFVARFEKEAAALASLSHPNIVSIVDQGKSSNDTYYLVMEYVGGPSLREVMRGKALHWSDALRIVLDIARAIDYAHRSGVIHRDLKPENILFDTQAGFIPKVTDFGLAGFVKGKGEQRFALTETHVSMGTLAYMAPEQQINAKSVDGRADLYSLGVMMYELLVGEIPRGRFDAPSVLKPGIDRRVDSIVERCLKAAPQDRFSSVAELIAVLEPLVPGNTRTPAPRLRETSLGRARRLLSRAGNIAIRIAEVALLGAAMVVLAVAFLRSGRKEPEQLLRARGAVVDRKPLGVASVPGELAVNPERRTLRLHQGEEKIPVTFSGRSAELVGETIVFPGPEVRGAGCATPEVAGLEGETARVSAVLELPRAAPPSLAGTLRTWVAGEPPEPRAALALLGTGERYAAIVVYGKGRIALEWSLGQRQGVMMGPAMPGPQARLELEVDREGEMRAFVGDKRQAIGEPLRLGLDWKAALGDYPKPAMACLDAVCGFQQLTFEALVTPPPEPLSSPGPLLSSAMDRPQRKEPITDKKAEPKRPDAKKDPRKPAAKKAAEPRKADSRKSDSRAADSKKQSKTRH
ncbi:MAG: protein kinase [Deltaproteobacteria bacterium]|nr:protein kinase [Deltaproteobacteria bacterium]